MDSDDVKPPVNPYAAQQDLLYERLHYFISSLFPALRSDIVRVLEVEGKLLAKDQSVQSFPAGMWSLLTLLVALHIAPDIESQCASSVAIAIEFFICALDLLDDIEDDDSTPIVQTLGEARVLNVSTALLALTQQAILSLAQLNVPAERIFRLLNALQASTLLATVGQHRDLLAEQRSAQEITYEECIEIAAGKAGALMSLACKLGAICAGADEQVCEKFAELGELLGIAHQLDNDSHDLYHLLQGHSSALESASTPQSRKTDLARNKKTLPVVLAGSREAPLQGSAWLADDNIEEHMQALQEGIVTTWGICLLYRERARDCLQEIEAQRPIDPLLRMLLGL